MEIINDGEEQYKILGITDFVIEILDKSDIIINKLDSILSQFDSTNVKTC